MGSSSLGVESAGNEEHSEAVVVEPVEFLLDAAPALVQGVPGKADGMERVHHCRRGLAVGSSSLAAVLDQVNPSIATTSTPSHRALGHCASHALNAALEQPSTMSSNLAGPVPARTTSWAATRTGHEPAAG